MSARTAAALAVAGCAAAWGFIAIVVREIDMPPTAIVFWRVMLTGTALLAGLVALRRRDLLRPPTRAAYVTGVLVAAHWAAFFGAIKETSVASAVLVTYAGPALAALLAPLVLRERVPPVSLAALLVSLGGIALISLSGGGSGAVRPLGVALAAVAAALFGVMLVLLKRYAGSASPFTWVLYESLAGALLLAPFAALGGGFEMSAGDAAYIALLGLVLTGALGVVFIASVPHVPVSTTGTLMYLEPVAAAVLAALLLGESLTWQVAVGGAAIVLAGVAVVLVQREPISPPEEPVPLGPGPSEALAGR